MLLHFAKNVVTELVFGDDQHYRVKAYIRKFMHKLAQKCVSLCFLIFNPDIIYQHKKLPQ